VALILHEQAFVLIHNGNITMTQSRILINKMSFNLHDGTVLFNELTLAISRHKTGLVGRNGIGKSTLIKLILGELSPHSGSIQVEGRLAYVPQNLIYASDTTIAQVLGCEDKLNALQRIKQGSTDDRDYLMLEDDWDIEDRIQKQLAVFGLSSIPYHSQLKILSGGEKTRLLLARTFLSDADFLLLDEPTNHLDASARQELYHAIQQWEGGLIVISHDRMLLNLMEEIVELTTLGAACYGGNYDAYENQKTIEKSAKEKQLHDAKKLLQKAKATVQLSREKHEQKQSYGRELKRSGSIDKMAADSKKGRSERTQSKLLIKEERLMSQAGSQLQSIREKIEIDEVINVDLPATIVPNGKVILDIEGLVFAYPDAKNTIIKDFNLTVVGPERIALVGDNGSGKTTLIKLILQELQPKSGKIYVGTGLVSYLDQDASLLNPGLSILENFLYLNPDANENDAYRCLAQFLFRNISARKLVNDLSGGEKLRALLACDLMSSNPPQLLILDEPTNHLDLNSIASIESALRNYLGAMIVISHDQRFLENIGVTRISTVFKN
jgi:ATPase subunit of ABC transporter with duplicated ATPase domains